MKLPVALILITLLALGFAACGGDDEPDGAEDGAEAAGGVEAAGGGGTDESTFDAEGFDLSFQYPSDFETREDVDFSRAAGVDATATAAVGIDGTNLIAVQRFDLEGEVTNRSFARVQREVDELFSELAGEPVEGIRRRVGGRSALEYRIELEDPPDAETRAIAIFDGDVQYLINCQSDPEHRDRIEQACDRALFTLELEPPE